MYSMRHRKVSVPFAFPNKDPGGKVHVKSREPRRRAVLRAFSSCRASYVPYA